MDLGTGDGASVIRMARRDPRALVIGIDANASAMRAASRHAARPGRKGGLPNALFVVAAAEALPAEIDGRIDTLQVCLPWGSLLAGAVRAEAWLTSAVLRALRQDGELRLLLSVTERDAAPGLRPLDAGAVQDMARRYEEAGFAALDARPATEDDVAATGSGWARRLGIPARREAWWLRLRATADPVGGTRRPGLSV